MFSVDQRLGKVKAHLVQADDRSRSDGSSEVESAMADQELRRGVSFHASAERLIPHPVDRVWAMLVSNEAPQPMVVVARVSSGEQGEIGWSTDLVTRWRGRLYGTSICVTGVVPRTSLAFRQTGDGALEGCQRYELEEREAGVLLRSTLEVTVPRASTTIRRVTQKSVETDLAVLSAVLDGDAKRVRQLQKRASGPDVVGLLPIYIGVLFATLGIVFDFSLGVALSVLLVLTGAGDRWASRRWRAHEMRWLILVSSLMTGAIVVFVFMGLRAHA